MSAKREKIAATIRGLLAKTVENGCTEDEAVAAAAKAAEMLARYNLTVDEVELRASPFGRHREHHEDAVGERLWKVAASIAYLTDARYWVSPPGVRPIEINFFGFEHEVAIAKYLLAICANAMRSELVKMNRRLGLLRVEVRKRKAGAFLDGMADSLERRIRWLAPPRPQGTGLVIVKGDLIVAAMKEAGIKTKQHNARRSWDLDSEYVHGVRAGERVGLNPGVAAETRPKNLLR